MVTAKEKAKKATPAKAPVTEKAPSKKTTVPATRLSTNKRKAAAAYIDACLAVNDKPTARKVASKPSVPKPTKIPAKVLIPTQDRVAQLRRAFQGNKSSVDYKNELPTATELHWLVAASRNWACSKLSDKEVSAFESAMKTAIKNCGDVDVVNDHNETPLHWASVINSTDAVKLLLTHGANVNAMADGGAPLHYATAAAYSEIAKTLLKAGADASLRNKQKKLPISFVSTTMKKFFDQDVEAAKVHILQMDFVRGKMPTLSKWDMISAIDAAVEYQTAIIQYENTPNYFLQQNGVQLVFGLPTCNRCNKTFEDKKSYAKHMLSLEHILKNNRTTHEAMREAKAYLDFKNVFSDVYGRRKMSSDVLEDYPGGL